LDRFFFEGKRISDKEVEIMHNVCRTTAWAVLALAAAGCSRWFDAEQATNSSPNSDPAEAATGNAGNADIAVQSNQPEAAVREFLEAIRTGNDKKATEMLSTVAQQKAAALNRNLTPPASDTARFTVGKVEYVGKDGARVASTWTDFDETGQSRSDQALWVLRHEAGGWRIAGVAAEVFSGEPPLLLNFEDPEDMSRKQQWVREEIRRRMEKAQGQLQAKEEEKSKKSVQR
jgi:hypothetical protein